MKLSNIMSVAGRNLSVAMDVHYLLILQSIK